MNSRSKGIITSLFFAQNMRSIVVAGVCGLVFLFSAAFSMADDYRWDGSPDPAGDDQYIPVDPEICKCYEENLRYFAKRNTPMSCNRPIAPHLKDRIKEVEWEDLDPDQYPDLFRAIATSGQYSPGTGEDIIQRHLIYIRARIANKVWVFRRAKLSLVGSEPYWIVQYGPNDISPINPEPFYKCKPRRGGGKESYLKLYIVSDAKHELKSKLFSHRGAEGQHLIIIDDRLFVENIRPKAEIQLNEVDTAIPGGNTVCIFQFKKSN
jgi:hypothetical protein